MNLGFSQKFKDGKATNFVAKIWAGFIESDNYGFFLNWIWENEMIISNIDDKYLSETIKPKLHTIREDKTDRWTAGKLIHFIINNRQPNRFLFAPVIPVVSTQKIEIINRKDYRLVKVDNEILYELGTHSCYLTSEFKKLIWNDGFDASEGPGVFFEYFDRDFSGKIIHWTDLKY